MSKPKRIQRRRTKGWRLPEGAVCVTRPGRWGNRFKPGSRHPWNGRVIQDAADAVAVYRQWLFQWKEGQAIAAAAKSELRGKDLACWCPPGKPCHADVLLELANR